MALFHPHLHSRAGVANLSETKSHIFSCAAAKSHIGRGVVPGIFRWGLTVPTWGLSNLGGGGSRHSPHWQRQILDLDLVEYFFKKVEKALNVYEIKFDTLGKFVHCVQFLHLVYLWHCILSQNISSYNNSSLVV